MNINPDNLQIRTALMQMLEHRPESEWVNRAR